MDVILKSIQCNRDLPVWLIESDFQFTCNGEERCRFASGNYVDISGKLILDGYYNYANKDTYVDLVGGFETLTDRYDIEHVVDLCDLDGDTYYAGDDAWNNNENDDGDDANANAHDDQWYNNYYGNDDQYNDDANDDQYNDDAYAAQARNDDDANRMLDEDGCPADGMYEFSVQVPVFDGKWTSTGWGANADLQMHGHDGSVIASCQLNFKTKTTSAWAMPASVFMVGLVLAVGAMLFYVVFYFLRREMICGYPCGNKKDVKRHRHEAKDYTEWEKDLKDEEPGLAEITRESGRGLSGPKLMRKPAPAKRMVLQSKDDLKSDDSGEGLLS